MTKESTPEPTIGEAWANVKTAFNEIDWTEVNRKVAEALAELERALTPKHHVCEVCLLEPDLEGLGDEARAEFWAIHNEVVHGAVL